MKRGGSAGGVGNFAKGAARKAYQAKTAPLQVASRLAQRIAPDSLVAGGLRKAASPFKKGGLAIKGQGKAFLKSNGMKKGGLVGGGRQARQDRQK
jgi:hypothetical protein